MFSDSLRFFDIWKNITFHLALKNRIPLKNYNDCDDSHYTSRNSTIIIILRNMKEFFKNIESIFMMILNLSQNKEPSWRVQE